MINNVMNQGIQHIKRPLAATAEMPSPKRFFSEEHKQTCWSQLEGEDAKNMVKHLIAVGSQRPYTQNESGDAQALLRTHTLKLESLINFNRVANLPESQQRENGEEMMKLQDGINKLIKGIGRLD